MRSTESDVVAWALPRLRVAEPGAEPSSPEARKGRRGPSSFGMPGVSCAPCPSARRSPGMPEKTGTSRASSAASNPLRVVSSGRQKS